METQRLGWVDFLKGLAISPVLCLEALQSGKERFFALAAGGKQYV